MIKLCIIGAGSTVFTKNIITDLLLMDEFQNMEFALMDINHERLKLTYNIILSIANQLKISPNISMYTNRREALKNSNFIQTTFQVGGYEPSTVIDFDIPKKYGLKQTIADTLGIGGIMRGLRTIPVLNSIAKDISEICPNAILLQYVNPMCMNMIALYRKYPELKSIGLCHSVQGTAQMIADDLNINILDLEYDCVGINHMAFFTRLEKKFSDGRKKDLYPSLKLFGNRILKDEIISTRSKKIAFESDKILYEKVRYEILNRFGFFVTESSEHFAEYVPWFIKKNNEKLIEEYKIPINEYLDRCINYKKKWKNYKNNLDPVMSLELKKSHEYASEIMKAVVTNESFILNGNVYNNNIIENLPQDCVVEVPCTINSKGITPHKVPRIPTHLAALMQTNINVQLLTAEAALTQKKDLIYQAAMLDPHTGSELSIKEIYSLVDELLFAHKDFLPEYD